ncbi:GDP-mannose 4,6-dehydratase [Pelagibacteraceae bacterium]|jgi:nucleoside-diphosphate-sugar epimerase|nr:GDP-mannose 4,6-dehydratase [Pelagibacteraceae bacterium]|tara:strand:+ start:2162 stop:3139 length:978 start_codon:yes stop_codon:yes gene_type:complete
MNNLKNKKVLITGGAGFIGSHLTKRLVDIGAKVTVIVKYNSIIDSPRLLKVWNKINIIEADLRNTDSVSEMKKMNYDVVFHLAAYNHVGDSFKHVFENVNSNLLSTVNLLNHGPKIKKLINMGTSEIYGIQKKLPFNTKEKPNPMSPYGVTKYASELFSILKSKHTNLNLICVRPFNTFGPYQSEKAIIPEIILKCLQNKEIKTTEGKQTREFNYVDNIIDGILFLDKKIKHSLQPINIGSNKPIRIRDLVKKIHKYSESSSKLRIGDLKYRPNEIWNMQANNKLITSKGWKPKISFDNGLKSTINWYKNFYNLYLSKKGKFKNL